LKKLILLSLLFFNYSLGQWTFSETKDPFDGNIKKVIGFGFGGDFPYKNPKLIFRINGNKREIYISNAGSTACDKPFIDVSFGDPDAVKSFDLSESVDRDAGFINMTETRKIFDFVKNLMKKNTVFIRFGTNCSANEFQISLRGSTKALSKIFPDIDFSSFSSNYDFGNVYSSADNEKISKSKMFFKKFINMNNIELSPYDLNLVFKEMSKRISIHKLVLSEIIVKKHKFLPNTIKFNLGYGGEHFQDTEYVFNKKDKED
jgi:hypothetical protein